METLKLIRLYGEGVDDFDTSPFESLEMLHIRSELHKLALTKEEQKALAATDVQLLSKAQNMYEHIRKVYDFSTSTEPLEEWWWHLDKLLRGEIILNASPVKKEVI